MDFEFINSTVMHFRKNSRNLTNFIRSKFGLKKVGVVFNKTAEESITQEIFELIPQTNAILVRVNGGKPVLISENKEEMPYFMTVSLRIHNNTIQKVDAEKTFLNEFINFVG